MLIFHGVVAASKEMQFLGENNQGIVYHRCWLDQGVGHHNLADPKRCPSKENALD